MAHILVVDDEPLIAMLAEDLYRVPKKEISLDDLRRLIVDWNLQKEK